MESAVSELRDRLTELTSEELAALTADLWTAQGHTTQRNGRFVTVVHETAGNDRFTVLGRRVFDRIRPNPAEPEEYSGVVLGRRRPPKWVDSENVAVHDVTDLAERILYGLDDDTRRELLTTHLDTSPEALAVPADRGDGVTSGYLPLDLSTTLGPLASGGGIAVLLVAALVVTAGVPGLAPSGTPTTNQVSSPAFTDERRGDSPPSVTESTTDSTATRTPLLVYPPGIDASGVQSLDALIRAHVTRLVNTSFRLQISYRERDDTGTWDFDTEWVYRESRTQYSSSIDLSGGTVRNAIAISNRETFADGRIRYDRKLFWDGSRYEATRVTDGTPIVDRSVRYVKLALTGAETSLVDRYRRAGRSFVRVSFSGGSWPNAENVSGTIQVDDRGVIWFLRVRFDDPAAGVTVSVTIIVGALGTAETSEPPWLDEAKNRTSVNVSE